MIRIRGLCGGSYWAAGRGATATRTLGVQQCGSIEALGVYEMQV